MADPLFVCHICAPGEVGGLERVVQGLARGHHERGLRSEVISVVGPGEGPHAFSTPLRDAGVTVHEIRLPARAVLTERRQVRDLLRTLAPDVLHSHGYRPDLLHATTARGMGIPTVTTEHGSSKLGGRTAFFEWLQLRLFPRHGAVIAVSSPIARRLESEGVPADVVHTIPNGWAGGADLLGRDEARAELGLDPGARVVAFVGRLIPAKGPDVFVHAMLELEDPQVTALVIGEGSERSRLEEEVVAAGARERFHFAGHVNPAVRYFRAFDLFVLSSRTEGTPIVLFEAMAAELPCVVTSVGGVPDVVGADGAVQVPSEDPPALTRAIRAVLAEPEAARERVRAASQRLAGEFSAERWLDRHEAVYRGLQSARDA